MALELLAAGGAALGIGMGVVCSKFSRWVEEGRQAVVSRAVAASKGAGWAAEGSKSGHPLDHLPPLMQRYIGLVQDDAGALMAPCAYVAFEQAGRMTSKPGARPIAFTAHQTMAVPHAEFSWRAAFPVLGPLLGIVCVDRLVRGEGALEVRLGSTVPVASGGSGDALAKGQLQRYLAELPWIPAAIVHQRGLVWRQVGEREVTVTGTVEGGSSAVAATVAFFMDDVGLIARAYAPDRPRDLGDGRSEPTPWQGDFSDWRRDDATGLLLPHAAAVAWLPLGAAPHVYWEGVLTSYAVHHGGGA